MRPLASVKPFTVKLTPVSTLNKRTAFPPLIVTL